MLHCRDCHWVPFSIALSLRSLDGVQRFRGRCLKRLLSPFLVSLAVGLFAITLWPTWGWSLQRCPAGLSRSAERKDAVTMGRAWGLIHLQPSGGLSSFCLSTLFTLALFLQDPVLGKLWKRRFRMPNASHGRFSIALLGSGHPRWPAAGGWWIVRAWDRWATGPGWACS